jgi:hypothetical protein
MTHPLPIVRGFARDYPTKTWKWDSAYRPSYGVADTLTAYCYQARIATPLFLPTVAWYTAGGTQTGYLEAEVVISISNAQSALLVPTIGYSLLVKWSPASSPSLVAAIVRAHLLVLPVAFN